MIELTDDARKCLDDYLGEMRASLAGCRSVDSLDVERDVMEHIEKSLAEAASPIESAALEDVLDQLGSPSQWIPEEELSWWRKLLFRGRRLLVQWRSGPEDSRLGRISIAILAVGAVWLSVSGDPSMPMFCVIFSFLFSRAALATVSDPAELGPQRWLIYPVLVLVYSIFLAGLLLWPIAPAIALGDLSAGSGFTLSDLSRLERGGEPVPTGGWESIPMWIVLATAFGVASTAFWWFLLGLVSWRWPMLVRNTFYPFANGFRGKHAIVFGAFGLLVFVGTLALGGLTIS